MIFKTGTVNIIIIVYSTVLNRSIPRMWLDMGKSTEMYMSYLACCILLAQLIATVMHYLWTTALTGLADLSAFVEQVLPTMWSYDWDNGAHGGH